MRLALDHHFPPLIAHGLCARSHDAVAAIEAGWEAEDDETLLGSCAQHRRSLVTNNVADFVVIGRRWLIEGRSHHGLVFTSDAGWPRTRDNIGRYVEALDALMRANTAEDSFIDRIQWIGHAG